MRVLLLSTYELGHQPLNLASPAGAPTAAGHEVRLDLSPDGWRDDVDWAEAAAFSVPMHTAMRLAVTAAAERDRRPALPVCFYGLYAIVSRSSPAPSPTTRSRASTSPASSPGWTA